MGLIFVGIIQIQKVMLGLYIIGIGIITTYKGLALIQNSLQLSRTAQPRTVGPLTTSTILIIKCRYMITWIKITYDYRKTNLVPSGPSSYTYVLRLLVDGLVNECSQSTF